MSKKKHANTDEIRAEFARQLLKVIGRANRKAVAQKLGISRQMLNLYLKGKATPGGEVIKKACDEWGLSLSIKGFHFSGEAFGREIPLPNRSDELYQSTLFELLDRLKNDQLEARVVGREGDSFILKLQIKIAA
jgi:transcriptional regulator with XRE-family HTH domain